MTTLVEYGTRCLYEDTNSYSVLVVRSASWLKLKSSHFKKCCEENFYLCVRIMQNRMEIFSTAAELLVRHLRLKVQKAQSPHYWKMGGNNLKFVNHYKYLGTVLSTEYWALRWQRHSETTAIKILCSKQVASLFFPMFKCSQKCTFSFLLYAHVCITNMVEFQKVMHAKIACGL